MRAKRILSLFLTLVLTLGLFGPSAASAADTPAAKLTPSAAEVAAGETFTLSLSAEGAAFAAFDGTLFYDADKVAFDEEASFEPGVRVLKREEGELFVSRVGEAPQDGAAALVLPFAARRGEGGEAVFTLSGAQTAAPGAKEATDLADASASVRVAEGKFTITLQAASDMALQADADGKTSKTGLEGIPAGKKVTLTLTAAGQYRLKKDSFKLNDETVIPASEEKGAQNGYKTAVLGKGAQWWQWQYTYVFEMPARDVTVSAEAEKGNMSTVFLAPFEKGTVEWADVNIGRYEPVSSPTTKPKPIIAFTPNTVADYRFLLTPAEEGYVAEAYVLTDLGSRYALKEASSEFGLPVTDRDMTLYPNFTLPTEDVQEEADLVIYTAEELEAFRDSVNRGERNHYRGVTVRLGADIDLTGRGWLPIGTNKPFYDTVYPFSGIFDGDGHSVTINGCGLFYYCEGALIENLTMRGRLTLTQDGGPFPDYNAAWAGGVVALANTNGIFRNCVNYATADDESNRGLHVAGIAYSCIYDSERYAPYPEEEVGFFRCVNYGDLKIIRKPYYDHESPTSARPVLRTGIPHGQAAGIAIRAQRIIECGNEADITAGITSTDGGTVEALGHSLTTIERSYSIGNMVSYSQYSSHMTATEGIYDCYTIGDVISKFRGTGSGPSRAAAMMIYNYTAAGTIRNCWAQGAYAFPEWDPHWALSFQRLEPFLAMIEANGVNTSATAEAPAKLSSAFNEDGTLVWQGKAAAATYAVRFANGEEDVTADIAVEGGTLREDGVYRLQNGTYSYSGSVKVGEESIPVSGAFNVANIGKVIPLTSKINFDLPDGAAVSVTREGGGAVLTADADGAYKLPNGAYAYTVTKEGCESVSGAFGADGNSRTIKIAALRSLVRVVFTGLPAGAALTLLRDGLPVDPDAAGTRVYTLADGIEYTYAAGAEGFVGVTGTYTASAAETSKAITLAPAGAEVTITTLPADASVELRDASGAVIPPRADGRTYMLAANTDYDYTARAPYHEDKTGTLKSSDGDLTLTLARSVVRITFVTSPSGAEVTVTRAEDGAAQAPGEDGGKTFDLEAGYEYAYTVRAPYHADKTGSLFADKAKNVEETPVRNTVTAVFNVNPASAAFALTQGGRTVSPVSVGGGSYTYALGQGLIYSYSASAGGYNGTTREYVALTDGDTTDVELTNSAYGSNFISGNGYIGDAEVTEANKGVFSVAAGATGTITVNTAKPITLVGRGTDRGSLYENLFIDCLAAGADITLKDLYISEVIPSHTQVFYNALNFRGAGNKLNFSGTNIIDVDTNMSDKAAIHVPAGAELALGGLTDGDTLYLYKSNQAAGIGGNENEYNGDITFVRGNLFAKNSKQGALIGSGSGASAETASAPGDVTILGGSLCLLPISMGAGIGGSAGGSGGAKGTDVYMKGGTLTINVDYTGAAIGGGGYRGGNDAEGGTLHYLGGSIRVFIDENAVNSGDSVNEKWPVDKAGVSDVAITAKKVDAAGKEVYAFAFDTSLLKAPANIFTVADGEGTIYAGGLHKYSYINENRQKNAQLGISYTMDNWVPLSDPNLYLYLTGEDHTLTVNGELFTATWKGKAQGFHITAGARRGVSVGSVTGGGSLSADKAAYVSGETVTVTVLPDEGRRLKAGSLLCSYGGADHAITETNGVYSFTMPEAKVTLTAVFEEIPPDAPRRAITIAAGITGGTLAIADGKTEAAAGERVAVTVTPARGKQLAAGSPKANGTSLARGEDGAYGFLMPDEAVTITAVFEDIGIETPNGVLFKTGAAQDLKLTINKAFALFAGNVTLKHNATGLVTYLAQADNEEKDNNDYRAEEGGTEEGGTVITVFKLYTDTLSEGDYTLAVHFGDGTVAEKSFSVRDTPVFKIVVDPAVTAGELTPDKTQAAAGEEITVTVRPGEGLRLVPGSLKWDGRAINADETGKYAFTMPAWDCLLTAEFIEVNAPVTPPEQGADEEAFKEGIKGTGDIRAAVWDGKSIDLRWFDPDKSSYTISTPAELAGLAALVNGLYNREIDTIAGKAAYIRVNTGLGDDDGPQGNNKSTATYHYGDYNFADKTVRLGADIYMGEGNNYMPIGGQYLMTKNKSETRVDASFNGVFDGRGHSVYIYTDRHVSGGNFGDGSSVGLIGRLGVHDNDAQSLRASGLAVKNVAVYGSVRANRSVGGIVGKIGKTADNCAVIENCANFASVSSTDAKGVGGIAGAAWNGGVIRDCYNAGTVSGTHTNPAGGIAGSVEVSIENSYSRGGVTAPADYAMGIGTNSGGGSYTNSYYLAGSARDGGWYTGGSDGSFDKSGERTAEYMTSDDFVRDLGTGFVKDTYKINKGYPVLRWQGGTAVSGGGNEETPGAKPSVDVPAKTTVKEGEAVTVVEIPDADVPLAGGESARLVVNVDTGGEAVNKVTAELPKAFVKQAAESKSEVEIKSDLAAVLLPEKAVESLAAENKDIAVKAAKDEAAGGYTFTVEAGGKALAAVDGGIKALVPAPEANAGTVAVLVREDGTEEVIKKSAVKDGTVNVPLAGSATVKIIDNAKDFADVAADAWYGDAVKFASSHELFTGTGEEAFSPEASMTRAMLVTVLHRLEDEPLAAGELFTDVNASGYYAAAVDWASANGIAEGLGDGRFAPAGEITREQLAAFLCRYARSLGADVSAPGDISLFMDAKDVSSWAQEAMEWAVGAGLITGRSNIIGTELAPKDTATRAEVAAILRRFVEKVL